MIDPQPTLRLVIGLSAMGRVVSSLQYLAVSRSFRNDGPFSSEMSRLRRPFGGRLRGAEFLFGWPGVLAILLFLPILSAACVISACEGAVPVGLLGPYALANGLVALRSGFILDGADRITGVVAVACLIGTASRTDFAAATCLTFLAGQVTICYATAGLVKLAEPGWRSGDTLLASFSTSLLGRGSVYRFLVSRPALMPVFSCAVVAGEILWGLAPFFPPAVAILLLATAFLFHLATALLMGLNHFVWAFPALFPAAIYLSRWIYGR